MNILVPWSLATYLSLNGFHPLYRPLARVDAPGVRTFTPKKPGIDQFRALAEYGVYQDKLDLPPAEWIDCLESKLMFYEFVEAHGCADIWLQSNLSGDVELHHTAPVTRGDRPFLLHCESFLPIFFPFCQQGEDLDEAKVNTMRIFYRKLFEGRHCLGIISHLPETLAQLSHFFESSVIDRKLISMPVGLDCAYIADKVEKSSETIGFVFLNSAHQSTRSFALRGGISCLKLAIQLLPERNDVMFYFRTKRPTDEALTANGIDPKQLKRFEGDRIIWIEHYLPEEMLNVLLAKCHFLLLPSANLHSVSIMSALANGTIPIITDTIGTDVYIEDAVNGVVIRGVRSEIWARDEALRITRDQHSRFLKMEKIVSSALIGKVRDLLSRPEKIREMADAGRKTVRQRFDGPTFANRLIDHAKSYSMRTLDNSAPRHRSRSAGGERWIEDISHAHFMGPPQPVERVRLSNGSVFQVGKTFIFIPRTRSHEFTTNKDWSPLRAAYEEYSPKLATHERAAYASSLGQCLQQTRARVIHDGRLSPVIASGLDSLTFKERIWRLLHPYRIPFTIVRQTYRSLRSLGVVR